MKKYNHDSKSRIIKHACSAVLTLSLFAAASAANAVVALVGGLGNFDAANYEGQNAYGFEIKIEGLQASDLSQSWTGNKFGNPLIENYATGVYVRYQSAYSPIALQFVSATVPMTGSQSFAGTCYMGYPSYTTAGCDHFGVHINYAAMSKATTTSYRWMFEDPANPGHLVGSTATIMVPTPSYSFPNIGTPDIAATVELPPTPPAPIPQYGNATWVRVFKTELTREVNLNELVDTNPIVPQDAAQIETGYKLMQASPPPDSGGNHKQNGKLVNQGTPNSGSKAIIRRYESYEYTGAYDAITHEALCADPTCSVPISTEIGNLLAAQMAAVNINVPSLTVTKVGSGNVASADKIISCGSKCTSPYAIGTVVALTAQAASNNTFAGWAGVGAELCTGTTLTCNVTIGDAMNISATFNAVVATGGGGGGGGGGGSTAATLTVKTSGGKGTITSNPAGILCGSICSMSLSGKVIALTATPDAGFHFVNWSGACTGTSCTVVGNTSMSVQANFAKN